MKYILLFLILLLLACSSDDSKSEQKFIKYESDLLGSWKVVGSRKGSSDEDISTDCDAEFARFFFGSQTREFRGLQSGDNCSEQEIGYDLFDVVSLGEVIMTQGTTEFKYHASYDGNVLEFARYHITRYNTSPTSYEVIPSSELVWLQLEKQNQ